MRQLASHFRPVAGAPPLLAALTLTGRAPTGRTTGAVEHLRKSFSFASESEPPTVGYSFTMDDTLLAAFRAGDPDAIKTVYREFARPVATVARSIVGDDHLVDDIVQQTFTKAWRAAQSFDPSRRFAPWLYSIARRTAIDAARAERRPTRGDHEPEADVSIDPPSMEQTWEAFEVRRAIDTLPPEEQEVVKLSHTLRLTHSEIAKHLGIPIGTVKSRSNRAHRRLLVALAHLRAEQVPPPLESDERRQAP